MSSSGFLVPETAERDFPEGFRIVIGEFGRQEDPGGAAGLAGPDDIADQVHIPLCPRIRTCRKAQGGKGDGDKGIPDLFLRVIDDTVLPFAIPGQVLSPEIRMKRVVLIASASLRTGVRNGVELETIIFLARALDVEEDFQRVVKRAFAILPDGLEEGRRVRFRHSADDEIKILLVKGDVEGGGVVPLAERGGSDPPIRFLEQRLPLRLIPNPGYGEIVILGLQRHLQRLL